jgi:predicted enzyme related to lactoylglutathione lyase
MQCELQTSDSFTTMFIGENAGLSCLNRPEAEDSRMDSIVHFEIPADNMKRAEEFYKNAFGWNITRWEGGPMEYSMLGTTMSDENGMPKQPGAINGGLGKRGGPLTHPVVTVMVSDVNAALAKIESLGGKTVAPKMAIGDMGFTAYFKDTEGNTIGLFQPARQM